LGDHQVANRFSGIPTEGDTNLSDQKVGQKVHGKTGIFVAAAFGHFATKGGKKYLESHGFRILLLLYTMWVFCCDERGAKSTKKGSKNVVDKSKKVQGKSLKLECVRRQKAKGTRKIHHFCSWANYEYFANI
jgi:hypothetical protein